MEPLKYPIGKFERLDHYGQTHISNSIQEIERFSMALEEISRTITPSQWQTTYREGGWTLSQVIHHVADSHAQAFLRFKWALTEHNPVIKPYHQDAWAELSDNQANPADSIDLIRGVHRRWVLLMRQMKEADWLRSYYHPEQGRLVSLSEAACMYAWHGQHHLAHLKLVVEAQ